MKSSSEMAWRVAQKFHESSSEISWRLAQKFHEEYLRNIMKNLEQTKDLEPGSWTLDFPNKKQEC